MIHDAKVEVTCDARCCDGSEYVDLHWVYDDYSGFNGHYDSSDSVIEDALEDLDWVISDGKHFCCKDCFENSKS